MSICVVITHYTQKVETASVHPAATSVPSVLHASVLSRLACSSCSFLSALARAMGDAFSNTREAGTASFTAKFRELGISTLPVPLLSQLLPPPVPLFLLLLPLGCPGKRMRGGGVSSRDVTALYVVGKSATFRGLASQRHQLFIPRHKCRNAIRFTPRHCCGREHPSPSYRCGDTRRSPTHHM